jgi:hypothetical protein
MIDVINVNDKYYVQIDDFIDHLINCSESMMAFTGGEGFSHIVSQTLMTTVDTLKDLKNPYTAEEIWMA